MKKESKNNKIKFWANGVGFASAGAILVMLVFINIGPGVLKFMPMYGHNMNHMNMDEHRNEYLEHRDYIQNTMRDEGDYACCLEKSCSYCIEKDPKHGEGATCSCIDDVVNGLHPCGECIGEILEGHGNKYLRRYFAKAIAEEVGVEHLDTLRQIISEKYDVSIEEQQ